jgi:hypothetical protein
MSRHNVLAEVYFSYFRKAFGSNRIDPCELLPDWTKAELDALLRTGIFDDIVYKGRLISGVFLAAKNRLPRRGRISGNKVRI